MRKQNKPEKGLKHLQFVVVGREYFEKRLTEMQAKKETSETSKTNGMRIKK